MNVLDEFKNYKRKFVQISHRADQFFKQFEGNECLCFVECLRDKCNEMLEEHKDKVQKLKPNKDEKHI